MFFTSLWKLSSTHTLMSVFIMKGCWILSNALMCLLRLSFYLNIYLLFINLFILAVLGLSCSMRDLCCGMFSCSMRIPSSGMHVGSSSPTRDGTQAPCFGSVEFYPLDHKGSPEIIIRILVFVLLI